MPPRKNCAVARVADERQDVVPDAVAEEGLSRVAKLLLVAAKRLAEREASVRVKEENPA